MNEYINLLKGLHIVGFTAWFAGLFFLGRLLVAHSKSSVDAVKENLVSLESSIYKWICNPAMMLTFTFGIIMLVLEPSYFKQGGWMHIKLTLVVILLVYHLRSKSIMKHIQNGTKSYSASYLNVWNSILLVFLVAIVFLGVYKTALNMAVWGGSVVVLSLLVVILARRTKA